MKSRDVIKRLEADGWFLVRVKGSHHQFKHPDKPGLITVPHPKADIPMGTYHSIARLAGWKQEHLMRFPVVLHTDDGRHYGVTVPDLPGCFSAGDSLDEALEQARAAIDLHLEGLMDDANTQLPAPRPIADHQRNPDYANGVWALIDINTSRYDGKTEKINITVPHRVLHRIDAYASSHGQTRSGFLTQAALAAMKHRPVA